MKLKALDLFCGAGGATMGLIRAGFDVVGIDHNPKRGKRYPATFVCADALNPPVNLADFDFVWASPPCQAFVPASNINARAFTFPNLIPETRQLLAGHPVTCIENTSTAPVRSDVVLTGIMVGLPKLLRKRRFELSWFMLSPPVRRTPGNLRDGSLVPVMKNGTPVLDVRLDRERHGLPRYVRKAEAADAMGIDVESMTAEEIGEAIPPAYAEYIGRHAARAIRSSREGTTPAREVPMP